VILAADWVVPVAGAPVRDGAVHVDNGRVVAVGPEIGDPHRLTGAEQPCPAAHQLPGGNDPGANTRRDD
jgi:hypothetical protein